MYTIEKLKAFNLFELRKYARGIGVKRCSSLRKFELIGQILKVQAGEEQPCFDKRGRPHLSANIESKVETVKAGEAKKPPQKYLKALKATKQELLKQLDETYAQMRKTIIEEIDKLKKM